MVENDLLPGAKKKTGRFLTGGQQAFQNILPKQIIGFSMITLLSSYFVHILMPKLPTVL